MTRLSTLHLFLMLTLLAAACSHHEADLMLSQAAEALVERPERTLEWLEDPDCTRFPTRRLRADRALLLAQALEKMGVDTGGTALIQPAVDYYGRRRPLDKQALTWYYLGRAKLQDQNISDALVALMRAQSAAHKENDVRFQVRIQQTMGDVYSKSFLYEEALVQYDRAYALSRKAGEICQLNDVRYAMARTYNNLKQYDKADSLFNLLRLTKANEMDTLLYTRMLADYALLQVNYHHNYVMAEVLYGLALNRRRSLDSYNHWGAFAYVKAVNGKKEQSDILFKQLEQMGKDVTYSVQVWKGRALALQGSYATAYELLDKSVNRQAERVREVLGQSAYRAQRDYYEESYQHERKENRQVRIIIVLAFLVLMVGVYLLYLHLQRKERESLLRETALMDAASQLTGQLRAIEQERTNLQQQYVDIHQAHLKELGALLKTTLGANDSNIGVKQVTLYDKAQKAMEAIVNDLQGDRLFEERLNDCFDGAMAHLRTELPNHTEEYYRFAGFVFAGFDNETLMAITGTRSLDSIYAKKRRLRTDIVRSEAPHRALFQQLVR